MSKNSATISSCEVEWEGEKEFSLLLGIKPIPASRPRVTRWGVYYGKTYTQFRESCDVLIPQALSTLECPLSVHLEFCIPQPKQSKYNTPSGDIDNYMKAIFDVLTDKGYWGDDRQIVDVVACKYYAFDDLHPHTVVKCRPADEA